MNVAGLAAVTEPRFTREIARTPECARLAREFLERSIPDSPLLDSTRLIASELVTNAFQHGIGTITITLSTEGESNVKMSVTNDFDPAVGEPDLTVGEKSGQLVERGRGLPIVDELSSQWGWEISHSQLEVWASVTATS